MALTLVGLTLVGCGRFGFEQREPWRAQAEEACLSSKLVTPTAYMSRIGEIDGPGACGITYPFRIAAFAGGSVGLTNKVTLGCPIIPEIDGWIGDTVQPAAELYLGTTVAEIRAGSYSCRGRNNIRGAKTSEHAFGNAVDVMSFRLADGRELTVEKGWRGRPEDQAFLREVFVGACRHFTTVLAPGSDVYHYNHLHLDLARHDPRGRRHVCKPIIKFEPRLDPDRPPETVAVPRPAVRPLPQPAEPLDVEDEGDPYAVSSAPSTTRPSLSAEMAMPPRPPAATRPPAGLASPARPIAIAPVPLAAARPIVLQPQLWAEDNID